uniref:centrosome and spindle pole-associated protein 1 isoform X2 n=1 Tax=Monopterus albus TaxID=43700 RepID=UPI0009B41E24|nr:centrosome and spindle pole-associated protein 1 isoform X2 [Monopterus albus]
MPPASVAQGIIPNSDAGLGLSFLLGADYERKKQKLKEELQLDYKQYIAKIKGLKTSNPRPRPQGLSLPIDEKILAKEKLREERNKEYNLFLQDQAQIRRLKRGAPPIASKPGQVQTSDAMCISPPASHLSIFNTHTNIPTPHRRDAATLTEAVDIGKSTEPWDPGHRPRRPWQLYRPKEPYSSEEELISDKDEEVRHRSRKDSHSPEPEYKVERRNRERFQKVHRAPQDVKEVEAPGVHHQNSNDWVWKSDLQMPDSTRMTTRTRNAIRKDQAEFATGLMIGAIEEQTASQIRKEQYKQELLKQIAEQQRNKMREKELELKVAATGVTDPEKEPDRIKQFGIVNRQYDSWRWDRGKDTNLRPKDDKSVEDTEQRGPPGKSQVYYSPTVNQLIRKTVPESGMESAQGVPSLDYFNEDYHRDFSNMLGEVAIPRVAAVLPPVPPTVANHYKTPYDASYYYYGRRDPLDPYLSHYQNGLPGGVQQSGSSNSLSERAPPFRLNDHTEAHDQHRASLLDVGEVPADRSKQKRESALSYPEALRQQIKEREELKRREKEEKEQYEAKIEAEMMAYNPWGRSGGGAPIKDQKGNLFSDLNQMHRIIEESYRNPVLTNSGQTQKVLMRNGHTLEAEARNPLSHQLSGFNNQPTSQQLHRQDSYKEALKQQIEENKRKQAEERERRRAEEEKEEKRLAEQRARIQWEYEEEQRKQKKSLHRLENQSWTHEAKTRQEKEKRVRQEQETEKTIPESTGDRQEKQSQLSYKREPSPPIPTMQNKLTNPMTFRPFSAVSQSSSRTVHCASAPHYRRVRPKIPPLQNGQQEVIRELSGLCRYLREEQRQIEAQLGQTDRQESHFTPPSRHRGRPRVDASESVHIKVDQQTTRRPFSDAACVNMQNIREFNQLKYRDTASREEFLHMYPDPPTDAQSLDIQQQALLHEQQSKIMRMKKEQEHDILDQQLSQYPRNKPGRFIHSDTLLPSDTAFIDLYSGDPSEERVTHQRPPQPPAEPQERTAPWRRHDYDGVAVSKNQEEPEAQSLQSSAVETELNGEAKVRAHNLQHIRRQDSYTGEHNGTSEGLCSDEVDVLSLHSALESRVSVETVATEPWLRPGTSQALKRSGSRQRPNSRMDTRPWITDRGM